MNTAERTNIVAEYLLEIQTVLKSGDAREHAYRPAFQRMVEQLKPDVQVINEPAYTGGNAPDFLFKNGGVPIAYAECKDVTIDIKNKDVQKQATRYVDAFGRILLTNYYDFEILNEEGEVISISIAEYNDKEIVPITENLERLANIISDYITPSHRTIKSAKKLAKIMANKARILRDNALASLSENQESDIFAQYQTFKEALIHDLSEKDFADMYAQTLVYGLFVARYYDPTLPTFSRYEAQDLLPASNPLLKKFFGHVAGTDYDPKIAWLVDSLIDAYLSTDVYGLMHKEFVKKQKDPVLHFYETFLAEYDKGLRKNRGVYYTPVPVVSFIVRSVDEILKSKFYLSKGLADTSKIDHKVKIQGEDGRRKDGIKRITDQIHKVQVLDPALGTGTFLNEVIHEIYKTFEGQEGLWPKYVGNHLLPRLHGFELLMASYTMAHLKLGVTLKEEGYNGHERLSVWLTNSLEESVHEVPNLFMSQWLTEESNQASRIKSEMPIMVVLGNPPYSVSSGNKGASIMNLIQVYKENLNERNIQTLSDDYIKFIRFAENQVEKTGYGIVAMITNNSFIDGVTHRQMRKHLMETFNEIYILDLHGSAIKSEFSVDGGKDENVFNIQQGVSINLFIKTSESKKLARVYHADLLGKQEFKYKTLNENSFETIKWQKLKMSDPYYFFLPKDFDELEEYQKGFSIDEIFKVSTSGIKTHRDHLVIGQSIKEVEERLRYFFEEEDDNQIISKLNLKETSTWNLKQAKDQNAFDSSKIKDILYRPFDIQHIYYDSKLIDRDREEKMEHMNTLEENLGLICKRSRLIGTSTFQHVFVTDSMVDLNFLADQSFLFPLQLKDEAGSKVPNIDKEIWKQIDDIVGKTDPKDILDYIYAVLHSPQYREKYQDLLKIDFPRVSYPKDKKTFWKLAELGREIRKLHLLDFSKVNSFITTYPISGENYVDKKYPKYKNDKVFINDEQYFSNIPALVWEFFVGGYQPAQKWLKDRRGRELSVEDIEHYQKMVVALSETARIMKEIDKIKIV